jgi:hypothetical protein
MSPYLRPSPYNPARDKICGPPLVLTLQLAPHTSGPRDVPRCGALSLLQKTPQYRGGPAETAARLSAKLWTSVTGGRWQWHLTAISPNPLSPTRKLKANEERAVRGSSEIFEGVGLCSVLRALPPAAPPASPHTQTDNRDITSKDARGPRRGFVPQAQTVQTCISAGAPIAKLRPSTQTRRRYLAAKINLPL